MKSKKNVFITGASGFQGGAIARKLIEQGYEIVTLKRGLEVNEAEKDGIKMVKGGLEDRASLDHALSKSDTAVYSFPLVFDMELAISMTQNFIESAIKNQVGLVIFNTTFYLAKEETGLLALDLKVKIKELFDQSGLNVITVVPDIYLDNIAAPWSIPVIMENKIVHYPIAAETKQSFISHHDLGLYVSKVIERQDLIGQTLPIGGNLVTGEQITQAIAKKTNLDLMFIPVPVEEFEKQLAPGFGELAAREISNLYRYVEQNHEDFINKDFEKTNQELGVTPQSLDEWANQSF